MPSGATSDPAAGDEKKRPDLSYTQFSEEQLEEMAQVTAEDIARAAKTWRQVADKPFRNLLAATAGTRER